MLKVKETEEKLKEIKTNTQKPIMAFITFNQSQGKSICI